MMQLWWQPPWSFLVKEPEEELPLRKMPPVEVAPTESLKVQPTEEPPSEAESAELPAE
jgi:hypothetical protein